MVNQHRELIYHRHIREIYCSLAVVGGPAAGAESWANQYTGPACGAKKCFIAAAAAAGNITTTVYKGRWAGPMSSLLLLDVYQRDGIYRVGILEHFTQIKTNTKTIDI